MSTCLAFVLILTLPETQLPCETQELGQEKQSEHGGQNRGGGEGATAPVSDMFLPPLLSS